MFVPFKCMIETDLDIYVRVRACKKHNWKTAFS